MKNADNLHWKVDGIIPVIEDWHTMMCLLLVGLLLILEPLILSYVFLGYMEAALLHFFFTRKVYLVSAT